MVSCRVSQANRVDVTADEVSGPGCWSFECHQWSPAKPLRIVRGLRDLQMAMALAMATIDQILHGFILSNAGFDTLKWWLNGDVDMFLLIHFNVSFRNCFFNHL